MNANKPKDWLPYVKVNHNSQEVLFWCVLAVSTLALMAELSNFRFALATSVRECQLLHIQTQAALERAAGLSPIQVVRYCRNVSQPLSGQECVNLQDMALRPNLES